MTVTARLHRPGLVAAAVAVVPLGLLGRSLPGALGDLLGGVLYAVLVVLLLAAVAPATRPVVLGAVGLGVCVAVELAQLTTWPAALAEQWSPIRYVLGTSFAGPDLLAYAIGAALAGHGLQRAAERARARTGEAPVSSGRSG